MFNEGKNWKADGINNLQILQIENLQQFFFYKTYQTSDYSELCKLVNGRAICSFRLCGPEIANWQGR